jgi:hypothetical protein
MLTPSPSLVVSPTKVLIDDQIANLNMIHGIDNVAELEYGIDYSNYNIQNKILYLTPALMQEKILLMRIIELNKNNMISNIFLDEVHTISNWGHNFRPDYLMLSYNLKTFIDRTRVVGFTATANYRVVEDLMYQLGVNQEKIISPLQISDEKYHFDFSRTQSNMELVSELSGYIDSDIKNIVSKGYKSIVFTTSSLFTNKVFDQLSFDSKIHTSKFEGAETYKDFANGRTSVLIGSEDIGIGINLPSIPYVFHCGAPVSKSQYVQEIGRSGRANNRSVSKVFFRSRSNLSEREKLILDYKTDIHVIIDELKDEIIDSDIFDVFTRILGGIEYPEHVTSRVLDLFNEIMQIEHHGWIRFAYKNSSNIGEEQKRFQYYLYFLHRIGIVYDWYTHSASENHEYFEVFVDVSDNAGSVKSCKQYTLDYLAHMKAEQKTLYIIRESKSHKEIIIEFIEWYYQQFLYYHREQYNNMISFFNQFEKADDKKISENLRTYFQLSVEKIIEDNQTYSNLDLESAINMTDGRLDSDTMSNLEQISESVYNEKLDFIIFSQRLKDSRFEVERLDRLLENLNKQDLPLLYNEIPKFYDLLINDKDRLEFVVSLSKYFSLNDVLDRIFENNQRDLIYYGFLANEINPIFRRI